jgi:hypothetical protein
MRPDMPKILVERPRPQSRVSRGRDGRKFRDQSDAPFLPMKAGYRDPKSLNENLRPLARYLERQVGRPWDKVYSEVCAVIDGRSAVQRHILEHLHQYVAVHTRVVDRCWFEVDIAALPPPPELRWDVLRRRTVNFRTSPSHRREDDRFTIEV